jgi:hypothetical protein
MEVIWPYQEQITYVISRNDWGTNEKLHFITENIVENISALRNEQGKDILLVGGGKLTSILLAADLIDEMYAAHRANLNVSEADYQVNEVLSGVLPQINASGSFDHSLVLLWRNFINSLKSMFCVL